jgi:adenylate cyclase
MKYQYLVIIIALVIFTTLIESTGVIHFLEMKALDVRYNVRGSLFNQTEQPQDIVVIGIDDQSIAKIKEPFILWDTFFAEIIEKLGKYQAKVIGLDVIWTKRIDDFIKRSTKERNALRRALLIAKNKYGTKVVMGIGATVRKKANSEVLETDSLLPMKHFGTIVGRSGFGVVNTLPDSDNYIRRMKLQYQSTVSEKNKLPGFSNRIAAHFLQQLPLASDETLLINYQLNRQFRILPFLEVLEQARADNAAYFNEAFKDKVVLVGWTNVSGDILPSPVAQETPGIIIHAHAIDMMMHDNYLLITGVLSHIVMSLILAFIIVFISSRFGIRISAIATGLVLVLFTAVNLAFFYANVFIPYVAPALLIIGSFAITYLYRFVTEERSKRRLAKFFRSYVNEQVVQDILNLDKPVDLEGKRERICILFSDVRSFTTFSENRPPEEVVRTLNEYFSEMTEVILDNNGTVDKFIGDGLMAFFGAPLHIKNPTLAAVRAAVQMREKLAELNIKWAAEGREQLDNGIGLHTGYALVGNIGSSRKMDYTAIGDSVNIASRVEGVTKTKGAPVLVTKDAFEYISDKVISNPVGEAALKGRASIFVYEIKAMREGNES